MPQSLTFVVTPLFGIDFVDVGDVNLQGEHSRLVVGHTGEEFAGVAVHDLYSIGWQSHRRMRRRR